MAKPRLLQTACAVALLAAAPAFAQTSTQPADTGPNNSVNAPVDHGMSAPASRMAPGDRMGAHMDSHMDSMSGHTGHRTAMNNHPRSRSDRSQNAAVDQLNDQSYQAAQRGMSFGPSDMSGSMTGPTTMPGGPTGPVNAASGAGGGSDSGAR
jgi:hypothetical protein